jgi:hypothetical protein
MIGQILPNNNERCYSNFSPTFREVNTPEHTAAMQLVRGPIRICMHAAVRHMWYDQALGGYDYSCY